MGFLAICRKLKAGIRFSPGAEDGASSQRDVCFQEHVGLHRPLTSARLPRSPWCAFALGVLPWRGAPVRGFLQSRQLPLSLGSPVAAEGRDCGGRGGVQKRSQ